MNKDSLPNAAADLRGCNVPAGIAAIIPVALNFTRVICPAFLLFMSAMCCYFTGAAQENTETSQTTHAKIISPRTQAAMYDIVTLANGTFGYDIYLAGKKYIHQQTIPGLPGKKGFSTKQDAAKVASLVVQKIGQGKMPPTVSAEELKKLKIL